MAEEKGEIISGFVKQFYAGTPYLPGEIFLEHDIAEKEIIEEWLSKKRGAKVLLSLKPKPRQTAAISGKQDFAQRRSKRRRDHQRLLSKLRNIIPRTVQTTPQIRMDKPAIA